MKKKRMNDKERYSGDYWKKNVLERISEFVTQRVFGCNAIDFKQGLLRFNAHLVTHDPTKTSRRDRAIIDQTAKTLAPSSLASAWWTIDTGASHNVMGSSSSSSTAEPTRVVIDQTDLKRKVLQQNDSWRESKRLASERIAKQKGEGSASSSSTVVYKDMGPGATHSTAEQNIAKSSQDVSMDTLVKSPTKSPSPVRKAK